MFSTYIFLSFLFYFLNSFFLYFFSVFSFFHSFSFLNIICCCFFFSSALFSFQSLFLLFIHFPSCLFSFPLSSFFCFSLFLLFYLPLPLSLSPLAPKRGAPCLSQSLHSLLQRVKVRVHDAGTSLLAYLFTPLSSSRPRCFLPRYRRRRSDVFLFRCWQTVDDGTWHAQWQTMRPTFFKYTRRRHCHTRLGNEVLRTACVTMELESASCWSSGHNLWRNGLYSSYIQILIYSLTVG